MDILKGLQLDIEVRCVHGKSLQSCPTLGDPMDCSPLALLSMGFSRQEYWRGLPFPSPLYLFAFGQLHEA